MKNSKESQKKQKRILVTGAAGYLGIPVVDELIRRGHKVTALDSNLFGTLSHLLHFKNVEIRQQDFRDLTVSDLKTIDGVIHLAAIPNDPTGALFSKEICMEINGHAVHKFAFESYKAGCQRFLYMSTCSVYGAREGDDQSLCDENTPLDPVSAYAQAKMIGEFGVIEAIRAGLDAVIARGPTLYGISAVRTRFDLPVNRFCLQAHTHGHIYAIGRSLWRPLITVIDAAKALVCLLEAPTAKIEKRFFNIGNTKFNWRLGEVVDMIAAEFGVSSSEVPLGRDTRSYRVSSGRLAQALPQAVPKTDITHGISFLKNILRTGMFLPSDSFKSRYNAHTGYKELLATGKLDQDGRLAQKPFGSPS